MGLRHSFWFAILMGLFLLGCGGAQQTAPITNGDSSSDEEQPSQKALPSFLQEDFDPQRWTVWELSVAKGERRPSDQRGVRVFIQAGEVHLWWFPAVPGGIYQVVLTSVTGDADLFVYYPEAATFFFGIGFAPWLASTRPAGFRDVVTFQTGWNYPFWFGLFQRRFIAVYGVLPSTYRLIVWRIG